jgi:hypothetical protein
MKFRKEDASLNTQQTWAPGSHCSSEMSGTVAALQGGTTIVSLFCLLQESTSSDRRKTSSFELIGAQSDMYRTWNKTKWTDKR